MNRRLEWVGDGGGRWGRGSAGVVVQSPGKGVNEEKEQ